MTNADDLTPDDRRAVLQRLEILDAFAAAIERRGEVVQIVGDAASTDDAHARLRAALDLNEVQAVGVLDLQIRRFAIDQRQRVIDERDELRRLIQPPS